MEFLFETPIKIIFKEIFYKLTSLSSCTLRQNSRIADLNESHISSLLTRKYLTRLQQIVFIFKMSSCTSVQPKKTLFLHKYSPYDKFV